MGNLVFLYVPSARVHGTRTCAQLHSYVGRTRVPPSAASGRETGLESGLASVHCLARPTAQALSFGYSSTGDELAPRTF
jgi:hypothetical protein